eukprot:TRINITY_DN13600_c0_g2_i1.p1 TRINITY_DN13600_c0_g2~~TRINITY_DN13600_c0_g2_i1.p1  ORF type:complete len:648 (-),score=92.41 TRINITY_DN13600_c0_g2_i1:414-2357(-)
MTSPRRKEACNGVTNSPLDVAELNMHSPEPKESCNKSVTTTPQDCKNLYTPEKRYAALDGRLVDEDIDDDEIALLDDMLNKELESDDEDGSDDEDQSDPEGFDDLMGLFQDDDYDDDDFDHDEIQSAHSGDDDEFRDLDDEFGSQDDALEDSEPELAEESCSQWMAIRAQGIEVKLSRPGAASTLRQRVQQALQQGSGDASSDGEQACLKWEHAMVFDDCPPLLGVSGQKHAQSLAEHLSDLKVDFAWPREEPSLESTKVTKTDAVTKKDIEGSSKARSRSRDNPILRRNSRSLAARSRSRDKPPAPCPTKAKAKAKAERRVSWRKRSDASTWKTDSDDHISCDSGEAPNVAVDYNGVLVIYKPAYWTVTTGKAAFEACRSKHPKLQDWLRENLGWHYPFLSRNERAGLIHRLDVQTSGPILVGSNPAAFKHLRNNLHQHNFFKEYVALMHGAIPIRKSYGSMDYPLLTKKEGVGWRTVVDRRGEEALTHYEALAGYKSALGHGKTQRYTLVRLQLITGKTHQIRVHLMELAQQLGLKVHGIVGDYKYLPPKTLKLDTRLCRRVFLHCWRLHFPMPGLYGGDEETCKVRCNLPVELQNALKRLDLDEGLTAGYRKTNAYNNIMPRDEGSNADESVPGLREFSRARPR